MSSFFGGKKKREVESGGFVTVKYSNIVPTCVYQEIFGTLWSACVDFVGLQGTFTKFGTKLKKNYLNKLT